MTTKAKVTIVTNKIIEESGNIEKIPSLIENELGDFVCPNCNSKGNFQFFVESDIISFQGVYDKKKGWRITKPKYGPLKIKQVKCLECQKMVL